MRAVMTSSRVEEMKLNSHKLKQMFLDEDLIEKSAVLINSGLVYCRLLVIILVENLIFYNFILSTAISC